MSYSIDLRERVISFIEGGGSKITLGADGALHDERVARYRQQMQEQK